MIWRLSSFSSNNQKPWTRPKTSLETIEELSQKSTKINYHWCCITFYQWFFNGEIFTILWILEEKIGECVCVCVFWCKMCLSRKNFITLGVNLKFEKKEKRKEKVHLMSLSCDHFQKIQWHTVQTSGWRFYFYFTSHSQKIFET